MNIYQMYVEHNKKPGFWIRRTTWGNTCAKVTSVGPLKGRPPYYGNPEVLADVFNIHAGTLVEKDAVVPVPGTYKTWRWVDPPEWTGEVAFSPEAGRIKLVVPFEQNAEVKKIGARWSDLLGCFWIPDTDEIAKAKAKAFGFCS
jgi:hypothetical protein